ncbi:MAG: hypothetical protein IKU86_06005, partial [Thermoguttaceae bacterium]|nr:hypothetical protein [Thermoguttaceae bacterium]
AEPAVAEALKALEKAKGKIDVEAKIATLAAVRDALAATNADSRVADFRAVLEIFPEMKPAEEAVANGAAEGEPAAVPAE